jgi:dienelactone hydrolase
MYLYDNDDIQIKNIGITEVKDRDYFCENSEIIYGTTILPIHHLKANSDIKSKKAVIYFPGSHALFRDNLRYPSFFDDLLQSGIDIIYPEYLSTYSRRDDVKTDLGNTSMKYRDNLINWVKEVRYAVDYAMQNGYEPHYLGVSWGGQLGVNILAIEDRFKTGILFVGGISLDDVREEIQPEKYAARIKTPTLLLNGRYDFYFPYKSSQLPLYNLMDLDNTNKRHVVVEYAHYVPYHIVAEESINWINR